MEGGGLPPLHRVALGALPAPKPLSPVAPPALDSRHGLGGDPVDGLFTFFGKKKKEPPSPAPSFYAASWNLLTTWLQNDGFLSSDFYELENGQKRDTRLLQFNLLYDKTKKLASNKETVDTNLANNTKEPADVNISPTYATDDQKDRALLEAAKLEAAKLEAAKHDYKTWYSDHFAADKRVEMVVNKVTHLMEKGEVKLFGFQEVDRKLLTEINNISNLKTHIAWGTIYQDGYLDAFKNNDTNKLEQIERSGRETDNPYGVAIAYDTRTFEEFEDFGRKHPFHDFGGTMFTVDGADEKAKAFSNGAASLVLRHKASGKIITAVAAHFKSDNGRQERNVIREREEAVLRQEMNHEHPAICLCDFNRANPMPTTKTGWQQVDSLLSEEDFKSRYTSVKLRSFGSQQENKIGDMQKKCIDNIWFRKKELAVIEEEVDGILTPTNLFNRVENGNDGERYMLPTTMNPSDHVPVVAHVMFKA